MDVVAHACAVRRVVVVAVDMDIFALADSDLCDIRKQVVGDALRVLAHES